MLELGIGAGFLPLFLVHLMMDANLHVTHPLKGPLRLEHLINVGHSAGEHLGNWNWQSGRVASTVVIPLVGLFKEGELRLGLGWQREAHASTFRPYDGSPGYRYAYYAESLGLEAGFHWNWKIEKFQLQVRLLSAYVPLFFLKLEEGHQGDFHRSIFNDPRTPTLDILNLSILVSI